MAGGERRLGVDHAGECVGDAVELMLAGRPHAVGGLPGGDGRHHPRILERPPEAAVVADRQQSVHQNSPTRSSGACPPKLRIDGET
jgi:hypothetical protein